MVAALEVYLESLREGRACSRDEFLAQHAGIAESLGDCLSVLEFIQAAAKPEDSSRSASTLRPEPVAPRARLGDYCIIREVGRGGMGVVYEALQVSLGRRVALKVLPFAAAIDPKRRQRFQIEAQAAAQLHHPHIVPVFGVGCEQGIHYYAMQFVDGRSLAAVIHESRCERSSRAGVGADVWSVPGAAATTEDASASSADRLDDDLAFAVPDEPGAIDRGDDADFRGRSTPRPDPPAGAPSSAPRVVVPVDQGRDFFRSVARLGVEAADALDHAHGLGILHRDIKPANLLIDPHGAAWITDFGLARFPTDFSLTGTNDVVGTLRYMSPEQAQARRGVVDQRTDIYSLGVTLYELLTLRPAFEGRDHQELLRQIATDEPVPPRRLNPAIPRDLETIVLKAMAKDPSHRYATAQELAADLGRFLADEPILARRPGLVERALRWARRHWEVVATATAVVMVSMAISTTLIWAQSRQTQIQAGKARVAAEKAEAAAEKAETASNAYHAYMIESFPLIEQSVRGAISNAQGLAMGQLGPARRQEGIQIFDQWVRILRQTSELPRSDRDSRIIIARAGTHLGYARAILSMVKGNPRGGCEPELLAQATEDYRRSIALFEELLAESPGDAKLRRYLADAVGVFGMGCCFRFAYRDGEAESCYRRAIQLRRDLVRGTGAVNAATVARADAAGEVSNFSYLISTMQILAWMQKGSRQQEELEGMPRQLEGDVKALAQRFPGPDDQSLRRMLADPLMSNLTAATRDGRRKMIEYCGLALTLAPDHTIANNNLAWALSVAPGDPWFDPKRALELARKAVALNPPDGNLWNTMGVAAYRAGDWKTATETLKKSNRINGGTGIDCFLLAMTCWRQGEREEARQWFDHGIAWVENSQSKDPEVRQFHAEAAALLGLHDSGSLPGSAAAPKAGAAPKGSGHSG